MHISLLVMLFCGLAFGQNWSAYIDTSSTNITNSFAGTNGKVVFPGTQQPRAIDTVYADNVSSSTGFAVNCSGGPNSIPSDTSGQNIYVASGEAWSLPDKTGFGNTCYIRSTGSTISSGIIVIDVIGK